MCSQSFIYKRKVEILDFQLNVYFLNQETLPIITTLQINISVRDFQAGMKKQHNEELQRVIRTLDKKNKEHNQVRVCKFHVCSSKNTIRCEYVTLHVCSLKNTIRYEYVTLHVCSLKNTIRYEYVTLHVCSSKNTIRYEYVTLHVCSSKNTITIRYECMRLNACVLPAISTPWLRVCFFYLA